MASSSGKKSVSEGAKKTLKPSTLNLMLLSAAVVILLVLFLGSFSMNGYLPFIGDVTGLAADNDRQNQVAEINPTGSSGASCASGNDCFPKACHNGVCTEDCHSHDECGGPNLNGYFCDFENRCVYAGQSISRMLCSEEIFCSGCGGFNSICNTEQGSLCIEDELSGDGKSYCAQSPFCVTGPSHEEDRGNGNLIFGTAIIPNYVLCKDNTAYRCIGYGQSQDPDYKYDNSTWAVTKCKGGETCVEGLNGEGGGCVQGRKKH
jgi:hypothetical protein